MGSRSIRRSTTPGPSASPSDWRTCWPHGRRRCPSTSRSPRTWPVTATGGRGSSSTPRRTCRSRPTCWCPTGEARRARRCWPSTGTDRASPGSAASTTPRPPRAATTPPNWPAAGHVVLAPDLRCFGERADWNPDDHYALRHQPGPPGHGRVEPTHPEPLGPGARPGRARGPSTGRPGPDRRGRLLLRGDDVAVPGGHRPSGGRRRGQRVLLVVVRGAQGPVEHVRLPGALRDAGPHGARRPRGTGGPPPTAGRERPRRPPVPAGRLGGRPGPVAAALRARRGRRPSGPRRLRR